MNIVKRKAYAKINLCLDITGKRSDGYHLVKTVMQSVDLYDVVSVEALQNAGEIVVECDNPALPLDERNLAYRAARLVMDEKNLKCGVKITIEKNIPMAAGLAGGSTDAAAVILGMDELFELAMSQEEMDGYAVRLGADVAFCLRRGTWLGEGIGEELTKLDDAPDAWALIVNDGFEVSTKWVYQEIDSLTEINHPDCESLLKAIEENSFEEMSKSLGNILEDVTIKKYPSIKMLKDLIKDTGAKGILMSGSGPTVFGLYETKESAARAAASLIEQNVKGRRIFTAQFVK